MIRHLTLTLLAAATLAALAPPSASAVTVYAAASLRDAFPRIDGRPRFSFAGSNTLQQQIERGAPADLFAAASPREPAALQRAGRCGTPVTFATNRLVLIVPKANRAGVRTVYDLDRGERKRVVVGTPGVPVGGYTRTLLKRMRLSRILDRNVVSQESNVAGVVSKVALGSADAGFVYVTDARTARDRIGVIRLPDYAQPPIRYALCVVRRGGVDAAGARAYVARVLSPRGRRLLAASGFGVPSRRR